MVRMIAASRACRIRAFWGVSLLAVGDVCAGLSAMVAIVIASSTLIPVAWPRPRACASMLRLMPFRAVSAGRKSMGVPVCLAMNLIRGEGLLLLMQGFFLLGAGVPGTR